MATINTDEATKSDLKAYCKKHDITQGDFVKFALGYFSKSGINPTDTPESVKEELAKIEKRINQQIAFQKTFEKERLNPLLKDLLEVLTRLKNTGGSPTPSGKTPNAPELEEIFSRYFTTTNKAITGTAFKTGEELINKTFNLLKVEGKLNSMDYKLGSISEENKSLSTLKYNLDRMIKALKESSKDFRKAYGEN